MQQDDPNSPLAVYMSEVSRIVPLAKDEEMQLFLQLARPGDWDEEEENVARKLIEGHLAQVVSVAQKHSDSGAPMLDLIQEGNKGLLSAVRSFAEKPIGDFSDYAETRIDEAIKKALG